MLYKNKIPLKNNTFTSDSKLKTSPNIIDLKRKEIIEKFSIKFDKIYHKSFEIGKLVRVMNYLLDKPEIVQNFNLEKDFDSYEIKVCERLNIQKSPYSLLEDLKANNNDYLPIPDLTNKHDIKDLNKSKQDNYRQNHVISKDNTKSSDDFLPFKSKIDVLKHKEKDEWAKIALIKSQEINEELAKKRRDEEQRRRKIREDLAQQIIIKKQKNNFDKEYEGYFIKLQSENNQKYDRNVNEKKLKYKNDNIRVQEITENLLKFKKDNYQEEFNEKRKEEILMLDKIKSEDEIEKKKQINKRLNEKILFQENIIETELMKKRKTELKQINKEKDKVYLDYNYFVDDKNCRSKHSFDERYVNLQENNGHSHTFNNRRSRIPEFQSQEELNKYHKEFDEKNEAIRQAEIEKKLRNGKSVKEMKETLANQVKERKLQQEESEKMNKKYFETIQKDLENYKVDMELKNKAIKDKYKEYKNQLKNQIDNRFNYNEKAITDNEIKLNKSLINKINMSLTGI